MRGLSATAYVGELLSYHFLYHSQVLYSGAADTVCITFHIPYVQDVQMDIPLDNGCNTELFHCNVSVSGRPEESIH